MSQEPAPSAEGFLIDDPVAPPGPESEVSGFTFTAPPAEEPASEPREPRQAITIPLKQSGAIDLEAMRGKTRARLQSAVEATPELFPQAGPPVALPNAAIDAIYHVIGALECWGVNSMKEKGQKKYPEEIVNRVFSYNEIELALIREPSNALIAKHLRKLKIPQEETTWLLVMTQIHFMKMQQLQMEMRRYYDGLAYQAAQADRARQKANGAPQPIAPQEPV